MNNNVAGMPRWSRSGLVLVEIACSRKSRAWTKRPSSVGGKNWRGLWQSDQPSRYVHRVRVAREQKKRGGGRTSIAEAGRTRNRGRSHERAEVGAESLTFLESASGRPWS